MDNDKLEINNLHEDDSFDVIVNGELEIHIRRNDIGYSVDLYKYVDPDKVDDDFYFDDTFIAGVTALDSDLEDEVED